MIDSFANGESPKALGFVMPPEWSAQEAVFLSWPSNPETWPGVFRRVEEAYAAFASAISQYERVRILCAASEFDRVNDALADADAHFGRIELLDIPTNDAWCRDHGPVFVKNPQMRPAGKYGGPGFTFGWTPCYTEKKKQGEKTPL